MSHIYLVIDDREYEPNLAKMTAKLLPEWLSVAEHTYDPSRGYITVFPECRNPQSQDAFGIPHRADKQVEWVEQFIQLVQDDNHYSIITRSWVIITAFRVVIKKKLISDKDITFIRVTDHGVLSFQLDEDARYADSLQLSIDQEVHSRLLRELMP